MKIGYILRVWLVEEQPILDNRRTKYIFGKRAATFLLLFFWLVLPRQTTAQEVPKTGAPKYILFLTADGFRSDYVEWYRPPHILQLIADGVRVVSVTNVFPTLTTPNMTSLLTGSYPRTTGIAANKQYVIELDKIVDSPRDNKAETIAETLRKAGWKTAGVNHFMLDKRGADVYVAPGYKDSVRTTEAVLNLLKNKKVGFVAAIYGATDHAGHKHGPRSQEVRDAVIEIDTAIGKLVEGLKAQGIYNQTLIVFNSDHGMSSFETKQVSADPAEILEKNGFRVATPENKLTLETDIVVIANGVHMIYFRKIISPAQKEKAFKVLSEIKGAEVLDRKRLDALGCHNNRSGDLIVSPLPGFTMSNAGSKGGLHGRFTEQNPLLFFWGSGIKKGGSVASARNVDVVPTLLHLANVPPAATVEGNVIKEVLK